MRTNNKGFTLIEIMVSLAVLAILAYAFFILFDALLNSSVLSQKETTALTLANTQMEYLKSLPYNNLAVEGGPIYSTQYIPGVIYKTVNGFKYVITTSIQYVDDAYDGCGSYPSLTLEKEYCRNYPPPTGAPNPGDTTDYKDVRVVVTDGNSGIQLAYLDTYIAPAVYGTSGSNGSLFVKVIDNNGNPVQGASVQVVNNDFNPVLDLSTTSDSNGIATFYNLPPDSKYDYVVSASMANYSSLTTIAEHGDLVPTYPNQKLLANQSSYVTLEIEPQGQYSLLLQTTNTSGNPLPGVQVYVKGGYKMYTSSSNTQYYFDTINQNNSPVTDSNGLYGMNNLVPGPYYFCGDSGSTGCSVNGTTYYLTAAIPYTGNNPLDPTVVPTYLSSNPPSTTFGYNGSNYLQKVMLMLTTSSSFPRVFSLSPYSGSISSGTLSDFSFNIFGANLSCNPNPSNCGTKVTLVQNSRNFVASCTGQGSGKTLSCTVNLSTASVGNTQLIIQNSGGTLTLPTTPSLGGIIIGQ